MFHYQRTPVRQRPVKKLKRYPTLVEEDEDENIMFAPTKPSHQFLNLPPPISRQPSLRVVRPRDDIDSILSSDLELSFASNVSLHSPPRDSVPLTSGCDYSDMMDISPAPPPPSKPFKLAPPLTKDNGTHKSLRPRAFTTATRTFGRDVSNDLPLNNFHAPTPAPAASQSGAKRTQRTALPTEWFNAPSRPVEPADKTMQSIIMFDPPTDPTPSDDAMDIDSFVAIDLPVHSHSNAPLTAAPTITSFDTGFGSLFHDTTSPRRSLDSPVGPILKKRRPASPEPVLHFEQDLSSSPAPSSPAQRKFERICSGPLPSLKPTLLGLGNPSFNTLKRPRGPMSATVRPSSEIPGGEPVLVPTKPAPPQRMPPPRRAFSALIPQTGFMNDLPSDESCSFEGPDLSSPAQAYANRQQTKTLRRCDGTDNFRPKTAAAPGITRNVMESPSAKFMGGGMPGFGDNEALGKILPCHRVKEDGLMRIVPQTMNDLLDGKHDNEIGKFFVIDCRFDYEFNGGHIPDALNINTTAAVEQFLLGPGVVKPKPSTSGDPCKKTVLIFHCEFSAKRAPTFAKHLRARDRALNNHVYPRIHFPEVYILEGGYCRYFKESALRCQPCAYVTMDDPLHSMSRREDLDQFRKAKFGRHKSYAYGEGPFKSTATSVVQSQQKRNTAPSGGATTLFAAATAARSRRGTNLMTLVEDGNTTAHSDGEEDETDIGDSPCPPPTKTTMLKGKKLGTRAPLVRAETYAPTRMVY